MREWEALIVPVRELDNVYDGVGSSVGVTEGDAVDVGDIVLLRSGVGELDGEIEGDVESVEDKVGVGVDVREEECDGTGDKVADGTGEGVGAERFAVLEKVPFTDALSVIAVVAA